MAHAGVPAVPPTPPVGCTLRGGAPAVQQFRPNSTGASGVKGTWSSSSSAKPPSSAGQQEGNAAAGPTLVHVRANELFDNASTSDPASAIGDYTLLAVNNNSPGNAPSSLKNAKGAGGGGGGGDADISVASADSAHSIWADFAEDGRLDGGVAAAAGSGAIAVAATIPAGAKRSLTLVFAWHFPQVRKDLLFYYAILQ